MSDEQPEGVQEPPAAEPGWALSFGAVADAYERGRPSYPREAAAWLTGPEPVVVLELGAGTGKLTSVLVELGHEVYATDPDRAMLDRLQERLPQVRVAQAGAEEIPLPDQSVDVVVAAQCFHWFDLDRALPEIARVLAPGGHLAVVWNKRNEKFPWVRRLGRLIGTQEQLREPADALVQSALFGFVEEQTFRHWQHIDRLSIQDLVLSRSNVAVLDEEARRAKLDEVVAFYDDYGRGMDGMELPYDTRCFRTVVIDRPPPPEPDPDPAEEAGPETGTDDGTATTDGAADEEAPAKVSDGTDTDMLLIDFR
jgi:ubiquinone/menaquinone biosynthesis C-methylase UbiE